MEEEEEDNYDAENLPYDSGLWDLRYRKLKDALRERVQLRQKITDFNATDALEVMIDFFTFDKVTRPGDLLRMSWDKIRFGISTDCLGVGFTRSLKLDHWDAENEYQLSLELKYDEMPFIKNMGWGNERFSDSLINVESEIRKSEEFQAIAKRSPISVRISDHWDFAGGG